MLSPAKRHFMKVQAEQEAAKAADSAIRPDASLYELMQAQLFEHKQQLKAIQSISGKAQKKTEILPEYEPYIEGVLAADTGAQDDVLMTILLWRLDAQDFEGALQLVDYAIKHGLNTPDAYDRSTACLIAEEVAEASLKEEIPLNLLLGLSAQVLGEDMPDQVKAKLHKALGLHTELQATEPNSALNHLQTALNLHDRSGVKKAIATLQKQIENPQQ